MFKLIHFRSPSLLVLSLLLLGLQAMAQFEVSPDHFDSPGARRVAHRRAAAKAQANIASIIKTRAAAQHKRYARNEGAATSKSAKQQTTAALGAR